MNKVAMMAGMEAVHGLSNNYSPKPTWVQSLFGAQSAAETNTDCLIPGFSQGDQHSGRLTTLHCFRHGKGSTLFLLE